MNFTDKKKYANKEKIVLLLIGRYFCKEYEVVEIGGLEIKEISEKLGIAKTTLSKPLGELLNDKIIRKDSKGKYSIVYHKIRQYLEKISKK